MVFTLILLLIIAILPIFVLIISSVNLSHNQKVIGIAAYGGSVVTIIYNLIALELRSRQLLIPFSLTYCIQSVLILVIGASSIKYFGFIGAISSIIIGYGISIYLGLTFWIKGFNINKIVFIEIRKLLKVGLPLLLSSLVYIFSTSIDRLIIAKYFGMEVLGKYQFAYLVFIAGTAISGIVAQYISPKLLYNHGLGVKPSENFQSVIKILFIIGFITILGWIPFKYITTFLITNYYMRYIEALPLINLFYFSAGLNIMSIVGVILNILNKQIISLINTTIIVLLLILSYYIAVKINATLIVFAYIFLIGQAVFILSKIGLGYWFVAEYQRMHIESV